MATARFITTLALKKLGVVGAGREPREPDSADALAALQSMYGSWIAAGSFGRLHEVTPKDEYYIARGNERIIRDSETTLEVVLPDYISAENSCDYGRRAEGRYGTVVKIYSFNGDTVIDILTGQPIGYAEPPRDGSAVVITDRSTGKTQPWLFDGNIKAWQSIGLLQLDDEAPRSTADPQGLAALLAIEISDQFGAEVGAVTLQQAQRYTNAMTQRWGMRREAIRKDYY